MKPSTRGGVLRTFHHDVRGPLCVHHLRERAFSSFLHVRSLFYFIRRWCSVTANRYAKAAFLAQASSSMLSRERQERGNGVGSVTHPLLLGAILQCTFLRWVPLLAPWKWRSATNPDCPIAALLWQVMSKSLHVGWRC